MTPRGREILSRYGTDSGRTLNRPRPTIEPRSDEAKRNELVVVAAMDIHVPAADRGLKRNERPFSHFGQSGPRVAKVDYRRAVNLVRGFRTSRRGGSRRRCGGRGLDPC